MFWSAPAVGSYDEGAEAVESAIPLTLEGLSGQLLLPLRPPFPQRKSTEGFLHFPVPKLVLRIFG